MLSNRMSFLKPSPTLAITTKARELKAAGKDIISLGAGEPDFDTPKNIKQKAIEAINNGDTKYTNVDGTIALKQAIVNKLRRENKLEYNLENICVGVGAKHVIFNTILALINPQDEVIIAAPFWVSYPDMVAFAQGVPVIVKCGAEENFKLSARNLEKAITSKTKCLILNSPSNPTGSTYSYNELLALAQLLEKYPDIYIISDDIYEHIIYDDFKYHTIAQIAPKLKERIITVNGVSKAYAMTGWRIGYCAASVNIIKAIAKLQSQSTSNPCSISQAAAVEALNGTQEFIKPNQRLFKIRRDLVIDFINNIKGLYCSKPTGAFYVFVSCENLIKNNNHNINNCSDFASYLLDEALVAVVPGVAFGMKNFFRISYATSNEALQEACNRIKRASEAVYSN